MKKFALTTLLSLTLATGCATQERKQPEIYNPPYRTIFDELSPEERQELLEKIVPENKKFFVRSYSQDKKNNTRFFVGFTVDKNLPSLNLESHTLLCAGYNLEQTLEPPFF